MSNMVFIGDSITLGLDVGAIHASAVNYGLGGDTTKGLLVRLAACKDLRNASTIIITIGINDLTYRTASADTITNYECILDAMPKDVKIFVNGILPVDDDKVPVSIKYKTNNMNINQLNEQIKTLCSYRDNCQYIDNKNLFFTAANAYMPDGIHLTPHGYSIWTNSLKASLPNVVKKSMRCK